MVDVSRCIQFMTVAKRKLKIFHKVLARFAGTGMLCSGELLDENIER